MELIRKIAILADAAKYDASCASSGAPRRSSTGEAGLGSTTGMGICHSYAPDGRCISLLKLLLTNFCLYDCQYCVNRRSSDIPRARFAVGEVVQLTLDFYRRNYIEGLFLSSGIIRSPDYTMEQLIEVARTLREVHDFRGYIHLKTIPDADERLIALAGRYADRLSVNIELPTATTLGALAPEKSAQTIKLAMARIRTRRDEKEAEPRAPRFAPAGQSTQMIVGADASNDATILEAASTLYASYKLKRVYYSAYSPIPRASARLPAKAPPLIREHRLYQADWLMRFYGFDASEITAAHHGSLDLEIDPKLAWALANRDRFPVDVNRASKEVLLRVPGLGMRNVKRILATRKHRKLRFDDLIKLRCDVGKAKAFVTTIDWRPMNDSQSSDRLRSTMTTSAAQLELL
ncbi:MAG TPA: putative DNA modification/repair radical SAM protein [Casimicrobiaceae bacterium]|nr:putative DNA modification/repair radical SAM protein [Casimicrobiaceae bacterium]